MAAHLSHTRRRLRHDEGFLLIEIMVSAMILILVSAFAMQALDQSDKLAGNQQRRTMAANVAQAELERVRSLPIQDISNLRSGSTGKSTQTLNGITYTINTGTKWYTDGKTSVDCIASNGGLDYLQATTSVSWSGMGQAKPLKMSTLISPSNRSTSEGNGSLAVQIVDADGEGMEAVAVTLNGPENFTDTTDVNGCVGWGNLDASGSWRVSFSKAGFVDANGNTAVDDTIALAGGATTTRQYRYDVAGFGKVLFRTRRIADTDEPTLQKNLTLANSEMASEKTLTFPDTNTWDGSAAPQVPLFPFVSSPYAVYAGTCAAARPPASVTLGAGQQAPSNLNITSSLTQTVFVFVPGLDIRVQNSSGVSLANATVVVTDACGVRHTRTTAGPDGKLTGPGQTGFPYFQTGGTICASFGGRKATLINQANTSYVSAPLRTLTIPSSGGGGTC